METTLKRRKGLDWAMIGSWSLTASQEVTVETVSGRDYTKAEILIFAPFAHNRFQPATFSPRYSLASYHQKVRVAWMWDNAYRYVDIEQVDGTHFKLTSSDNIPGDFQLLAFVLDYEGTY